MWPDSILTEIPTAVASEVLGYLADAPLSDAAKAWAATVRIDVTTARSQQALFGDARTTVGDDWMPL